MRKKLIKLSCKALYNRIPNKHFEKSVDQIPDKVKNHRIKFDNIIYKIKRVIYKLNGQEVCLTVFVQAWIDYRRFGDHQGTDFLIEYTLYPLPCEIVH
jgi:mRNA-degrading endonuclease HigB of HigAB toxin-antitoxin module